MSNESEKIRGAALALFNSKGLVNTSLEDIQFRSDVSKRTLEELYPKKKILVSEIYTQAKTEMLKFVYGEVLEIEDYQDLMRKVFHQSVLWGVNNAALFNFMNQVQSHPYDWTEIADDMIYPSVNKKIMARTASAIKSGVIKEFPIDFAVHFMTGMHASCVSYILSLNTITEEEYGDLIEPMYQACWDAFKK